MQKTFQSVKKDPKYRDLWFRNGKEIKSNNVFCKCHNLKEADHYFKKTNGTFYFTEDGLERLDELIERKVSDKTSQSISSTNYTERKIAESTTSERINEDDDKQLENLEKKRIDFDTHDSQKRKYFSERREEKYNEIKKIDEEEKNWNEHCIHQRDSFHKEEKEIRYRLRSKNITM